MAPRQQPDAVVPLGTDSDSEGQPQRRTWFSAVAVLTTCLAAVCVFAGRLTMSARADQQTDTVDILDFDSRGDEEPDYSKCSWGKQNCNATKCCNNGGHLCYQQSPWYAQCRESCSKSPDPLHWDATPWSCKELGERAAGQSGCSELGEDCRNSKCCKTTNTQCFQKNPDWATCKSECIAGGPDLSDVNGDPWTCKKLGPWTQGAAPWVASKCSKEGEDCSKTQCCSEPGAQCYKQSNFWAQCKYDCKSGKDPARSWEPAWSCDPLGIRTPGTGGKPIDQVGKWVPDQCSQSGTDCRKSRCCLGTNMQCYEKNKDWAMCLDKCSFGKHIDDNNETWSCKIMGPRNTQGLAVKGSPSIFCWSLFMTTSYENSIMKRQAETGTGIFQCDDWALLTATAPAGTVIGKTPDGVEAKTLHVVNAEITRSVDGTAGNAKLFINCWNSLLDDGRWKNYAWIIKVDPDAVIVPDRVRTHLRPHVMENVYVVNCNKFPNSPNFPMMYGSVEIYSYRAIETYARNFGSCLKDMGMMLPQWGEDYFMTHCLDHIGVGRISDFVSVGDNVCTGGSCSDAAFSAFHPFKTVDSWQQCWDQAMGKIPPPANPWR
jgi:hypothetical protein